MLWRFYHDLWTEEDLCMWRMEEYLYGGISGWR